MSFDTLAPCYRSMEFILAGPILQRARTAFLVEATSARRALLLGEGPGRFLNALLRSNPNIHITCVEQSARMHAEAQRHLAAADRDRIIFHEADALVWPPPREEFDLIATHFFLDCFKPVQLQSLIPKIAASATANARWLLADFGLPPGGWRRLRARAVLRLMYWFFRVVAKIPATEISPPDFYLQKSNFHLAARQHFNFDLIHADLWQRKELTERQIH
jgi:SAM-dependent methyltransferase